MNDTLIFDIKGLMGAGVGANDIYIFDGPIKLDELPLKSNVSGRATIMRIEEGLHIIVEKFSVKVELPCVRCLNDFVYSEKIPNFDRIFYFEKPEMVEDENDLFMVDKKRLAVDLSEMARQEIILHFPPISVCSRSCKGLCPVCGVNRNKKKCSCKVVSEETPDNKPLAGLKELLNSKNG